MDRIVFSTGNDKWSTPAWLYQDLDNEFGFDFDPCPLEQDKEVALTLFPEAYERTRVDGLQAEWGDCNFVNPPYSEVAKWVEKSYREHQKGKTVVLLIPSRTDTQWFHKWILPHAHEIRFCKGRLKFGGAKENAPFPSMIVVFKHEKHMLGKLIKKRLQKIWAKLTKKRKPDYTIKMGKHSYYRIER